MFKGKAHGIIPHLPNLNTVAIKTAMAVGRFLLAVDYSLLA